MLPSCVKLHCQKPVTTDRALWEKGRRTLVSSCLCLHSTSQKRKLPWEKSSQDRQRNAPPVCKSGGREEPPVHSASFLGERQKAFGCLYAKLGNVCVVDHVYVWTWPRCRSSHLAAYWKLLLSTASSAECGPLSSATASYFCEQTLVPKCSCAFLFKTMLGLPQIGSLILLLWLQLTWTEPKWVCGEPHKSKANINPEDNSQHASKDNLGRWFRPVVENLVRTSSVLSIVLELNSHSR